MDTEGFEPGNRTCPCGAGWILWRHEAERIRDLGLLPPRYCHACRAKRRRLREAGRDPNEGRRGPVEFRPRR